MIADGATLSVVAAALAVLAIGYGVVGALSAIPATSRSAAGIWPILNVEAAVVGAVCLVFLFAPLLLPLAFLAFAARIVWEAAAVTHRDGGRGRPLVWAGLAVVLLIAGFLLPWRLSLTLIGLAWIATAVLHWRVGDDPWPTGDLLLFPTLPVLAFAVACSATYPALFLAAWIGIETFDSYALLAGKVFGRRKAFPVLSPNKTVEGLAGGAVMLLATALIAAWLIAGVGLWAALAFAVLIAVFAVTGDLAASLMKRRAGVKDFPRLIPHQGGLFDMFDSWIATGAALAVVLLATGA